MHREYIMYKRKKPVYIVGCLIQLLIVISSWLHVNQSFESDNLELKTCLFVFQLC